MREVCATRKACPCHGGKTVSQHTGAVQGVRVQQPKDHSKEATQRLGVGLWGGAAKTHTANLSYCLSACISACLSACLTVSLSPPQPVGGLFQLKAEEGETPTHVATSSSIPDSICTDLQRAAL